MSGLHGRRALVLGLGVHGGGLGVARWLLQQGAEVTVTDMASAEALTTPLAALETTAQQLGASVRYVLGEHRAQDIEQADLLVANPAIRPDSPWLQLAAAAGVAIESEMTLFFARCPGPILAVTGTKGKTTTATMLAAMVRQAFPEAILAGNLRVSALEALPQITPTTPTILELSSFQLEGLRRVERSPQFAAITNFSPDHLNYHGTMEAYAEAKRTIFAFQDEDGILALPTALRDGWLAPPPEQRGQVLWVGPGGDYHFADGWAWGRGERLFAQAEVSLAGEHNQANALLAAALAHRFGVKPMQIAAALQTMTAIEHRQEVVAVIDGVTYINDTTATNPAAAIVALESLPQPIILLAGGADKGLPLKPLAEAAARRAKAVILLAGSASAALAAELAAAAAPQVLGPFDDLGVALAAARRLAQPGDRVVLSPGCASFGMFRNEFHRGDEFRRLVGELKP